MLLHHPEEALAWIRQSCVNYIADSVTHPYDVSLESCRERVTRLNRELLNTSQNTATSANGKAPRRFKSTLKDEYEFNRCIVVDVMCLDGKPVLYVVDEATAF